MSSEKPKYDEESGGSEVDKGRKFFEMGTSSNSRSFEVESWAFVPTQNYSLQLMQRVEPPLEGDRVPATVHELLSFFRVYTSTVGHSQLMSVVSRDFSRFLWNCVFSLIIKSLPLNYVTYFLSSYVPHQHMLINKMTPLMYGYNVLMIFSIMTNFAVAIEPLMLVLYYAYEGVIHIAPWNRCSEAFFREEERHAIINCVTLEKFCDIVTKIPGADFVALAYPYVFVPYSNGSGDLFTAAPLIFHFRADTTSNWRRSDSKIEVAAIASAILAVIGLTRKLIYKRIIWQVINYSNWILTVFHLGALFHILVFSLETKMVEKSNILKSITGRTLDSIDFDMLADALGSPPLLHFLASKSNHQINPAMDSAVLVFSNSLNYVLKGLVLFMLRRYSEHHYKMSFGKVSFINVSFIYWPIYLSLLPLGDFLGCVYFLLQGISEFLSFVIVYIIALECMQSAFPKLKWWLMIIVTLAYVMIFRIKMINDIGFWRRYVTYALSKGCIALTEMLVIICLYPLARLEDDITFHTGSPPAKVILFSIRLIPIYFGVKLYFSLITLYEMAAARNHGHQMNYITRLTFSVIAILIIGTLHPVIKNVCIKKQNWRSLFRPVPQWGPKDHIQRQLRKQYDSREYIASTASRYLSRFLKSRLTSRTYRLDVSYETERGRRRSTVAPQFDSLRYHDETKKDV